MQVGINSHLLWSDLTDQNRIALLNKFQTAGVRTIRMDVGWDTLQESGPGSLAKWYLSRMDFVINEARKRNMTVLLVPWGTPAWANGGKANNVPPIDVNDYASFMKLLSTHFKGRVEAYEVWNEPNLAHFWSGSVNTYVRLLKAAYPVIRRAAPGTLVVCAGPSYNSVEWVTGLYNAGVKGSFNVLATHSYPAPADAPPEQDNGDQWQIARIVQVRQLMEAKGDGGKPIWFTEVGWSSSVDFNTPETPPWNLGVSEATQADYLTRFFGLVRDYAPYVQRIHVYCDREYQGNGEWNGHMGLLHSDLSEKPAYVALKSWLT